MPVIKLPSTQWLRQYRKADFRYDLAAGLTVGVMIVPQGMAYAMLAGVPPIYGLYAAALPALAYVWMGTSGHLSIGPAAMTAMLTAVGVGAIAAPQTEAHLAMVGMLTLSVGVIQFGLGALRLGFLVNFLSHPVIRGFTMAAAILIGFSQVKHIFGVTIDVKTGLPGMIIEMVRQVPQMYAPALGIGLAAIGLLIVLRRIHPGIPAALIAVILGIGITWLLKLDKQGLPVAGEIPTGFPVFRLPELKLSDLATLLPTAFAVAMVGFMESSAVARIIQARHPDEYRLNSNRELMALGLSNLVSAFMKSIPVSGGMSRSLVNEQAGARTRLSSVFSTSLVLLALLVLAPLLYYLPNAVLAAIIIVAVASMLKMKDIRKLWQIDRKDFVMLAVTFTGTLLFGIGLGIAIGVFLSLAWIVFETSYPHHAELGRLPGTVNYRNVLRFPDAHREEGILIYRFDAPLYFANANRFCDVLHEYIQRRTEPVKTIIIDMDGVNSIDSTALTTLSGLVDDLDKENIRVYFSIVKGPVRDKLLRSGLTSRIGADHFFDSNEEAVVRAKATNQR